MTESDRTLLALVKASAVVEAAISAHAIQLDKWAKENAKKGDYSNAGLQQASAVSVRMGIAIAREAISKLIEQERAAPGKGVVR